MVGNIDGCIDPFQEDEILFYPFAKSKILDVDVSAIAVHPSLSLYATVAASCGMSRSHRILRT